MLTTAVFIVLELIITSISKKCSRLRLFGHFNILLSSRICILSYEIYLEDLLWWTKKYPFCYVWWLHENCSAGNSPGSCDQLRCPYSSAQALHSRRRCCCVLRDWRLDRHRWTETRRCWSWRRWAPGAQLEVWLPCAADKVPAGRKALQISPCCYAAGDKFVWNTATRQIELELKALIADNVTSTWK